MNLDNGRQIVFQAHMDNSNNLAWRIFTWTQSAGETNFYWGNTRHPDLNANHEYMFPDSGEITEIIRRICSVTDCATACANFAGGMAREIANFRIIRGEAPPGVDPAPEPPFDDVITDFSVGATVFVGARLFGIERLSEATAHNGRGAIQIFFDNNTELCFRFGEPASSVNSRPDPTEPEGPDNMGERRWQMYLWIGDTALQNQINSGNDTIQFYTAAGNRVGGAEDAPIFTFPFTARVTGIRNYPANQGYHSANMANEVESFYIRQGTRGAQHAITYRDAHATATDTAFSGSNTSALPAVHEYGITTNLVAGVKTGYDFGGWFTSSNPGSSDTARTSLLLTFNQPITLYAVWTPAVFDINYVLGGGTNPTGAPTNFTFGQGATLPTNPTRTGYTFDGWFTAAEGGTKVTAIAPTVAGDQTVYARWTAVPAGGGGNGGGGCNSTLTESFAGPVILLSLFAGAFVLFVIVKRKKEKA
jgi:uncharacterized repeat protein (TIGR02543 family)